MGTNIKKHMYLFFLFFLGVLFNLSTGVSYGAHVLQTSDKYIRNRAGEGQEISDSTIAGASQSDKKYPSLRFLKNYGKLVSWLRGKKKRYFTRVRSVYNSAQSRVQDNYLRYITIVSGVLVGGSFLRDILSHVYYSKYVSERIAQAEKEYSSEDLTRAIGNCDVAQVRKIIKGGVSPKQKDRYGGLPLAIAIDICPSTAEIEVSKLEITKALIAGGAEVNPVLNNGTTLLYQALYKQCPAKIIKLLLDGVATIEADPRYLNILCYRPDIVKVMLDKVDPKVRDAYVTDFLINMIEYKYACHSSESRMSSYESVIRALLGERELASILVVKPEFLHTVAEWFRDKEDLLALLFRLGAPFNQENSNNETVLGAHVRRGDIGSVRQLFDLSDRKNPNNKAMYENLGLDIVGSFILHQDCVGIVQGYLLNYCDVKETDSMGRTLLGIALTSCPMSQKERMIQLLIERGANLNQASSGALPLYLCVQMDDFRGGIRRRILDKLVQAKADPNVEVDSQAGDTILHRLSGNRLGSDVCPVLKYASDLEVRNKRGRTPLLTAVEEMDSELVMNMLGYHEDEPGLLAKPVNVHATIRETGDTALHIAVSKYKALENEDDSKKKESGRAIGVAVDLMQAKASVLVKNLEGKTPLQLAAGTKLYDIMQRATNGEVLIQDIDGNVI